MFRRRSVPPAPRLDPKLAKQLLATVPKPATFPGVDPGMTTVFEQSACSHCGGLHARNCPAVKRIEYHPDGKVAVVEFWPHGSWPTEDVLWLADVREAAGPEEDE